MLVAPAYAKINLSLEVLGRRSDGYHELISVMQTISLHDDLRFEQGSSISFTCSDTSLQTRDNLVVRAAMRLQEKFDVQEGCAIHLTKRTPAAAGLGGGSSDAAATLRVLNDLWNAGASDGELSAIASDLGSDVPFFLTAGTALIEGRGERVTALEDRSAGWFVLARPHQSLSTAAVFAAVEPKDYSNGDKTRALARDRHSGRVFGANGLQSAAFRVCQPAACCFAALEALLPGRVILSGSGPTSVASVQERAEAQEVGVALGGQGYWTAIARPVTRHEVTP